MAFPLKLDRPLVFFDIESTGKDPRTARIIDIAGIKVFPGGKTEKKFWRVDPTVPIPKETSKIHGIYAKHVSGKSTFAQEAEKIRTWFTGSDLAGHNVAGYDAPLLSAELSRAGKPLKGKVSLVDSLRIFREQVQAGKTKDYTLAAASEYYLHKEHIGAHSARIDIARTKRVFEAQMAEHKGLPKTPAGFGLSSIFAGVDTKQVPKAKKVVSKAGWTKSVFTSKRAGKLGKYALVSVGAAAVLPGSGGENLVSGLGFSLGYDYFGRGKPLGRKLLFGAAGAVSTKLGIGAYNLLFSGKDDAYNTIEGFKHGGMAETTRKRFTEFGSGYQGPNPWLNPSYNIVEEVPRYELARASKLGASPSELYKYFTRQEEPSEYLEATAYAGTALHRLEQARKIKSGEASASERFVYDPETGISGHIDIMYGGVPADIKSVSEKRMAEVREKGAFSKHISQINFYMYMTGAKKGYLEYIKREDLSDRETITVPFDPKRLAKDIEKLQSVRRRVTAGIESGRLRETALPRGASLQTLMEAAAAEKGQAEVDTRNIGFLSKIYRQELAYMNGLRFSGKDDAYNTIEGLKHDNMAEAIRRGLTDFGSGWGIGNILSVANSLFFIGTAGLTGYDRFGWKGAVGGAAVGIGIAAGTSLLKTDNAENSLAATLWSGAIEGIKTSASASMMASSFMKGATLGKFTEKVLLKRGLSIKEITGIMAEKYGLASEIAEMGGPYATAARGMKNLIEERIPGKIGKVIGKGIEAQTGSPTVLDLVVKYGSIQDVPGKEYIKANVKDIFMGAGAGTVISAPFATAVCLLKGDGNTIEGLHPGSEGLGAQSVRAHSDFGSGLNIWKVVQRAANWLKETRVGNWLRGTRNVGIPMEEFGRMQESVLKYEKQLNFMSVAAKRIREVAPVRSSIPAEIERRLEQRLIKLSSESKFSPVTQEELLFARRTGDNKVAENLLGGKEAANTIEGLRHDGLASQMRRRITDFGSGSKVAERIFRMAHKQAKQLKAGNIEEFLEEIYSSVGAKRTSALEFTEKSVARARLLGTEKVVSAKQHMVKVSSGMEAEVAKSRTFLSGVIGTQKYIAEGPQAAARVAETISKEGFTSLKKEVLASQYKLHGPLHEVFELAEGIGKGKFGTHAGKQVIEDEAFLAWSMGKESFEAMKALRAGEGRSMPEYQKVITDIYARAPKEAATQLKEMGLGRLNIKYVDDAVKRQTRFNKISTDAVGVGFRQAHNAGRRHGKFASTQSV